MSLATGARIQIFRDFSHSVSLHVKSCILRNRHLCALILTVFHILKSSCENGNEKANSVDTDDMAHFIWNYAVCPDIFYRCRDN